jgi:hypothetical protein
MGETIGTATKASRPPPEAASVQIRAVRVRPSVVESITPHDVNIVLQRLESPATARKFDLIIATNVLAYYDGFEQALALANIAKMLRPAGLFLANSALPELPGTPLRSVGHTDIAYTDGPHGGDRVVWYQRQ